jgi:hypothetical protein
MAAQPESPLPNQGDATAMITTGLSEADAAKHAAAVAPTAAPPLVPCQADVPGVLGAGAGAAEPGSTASAATIGYRKPVGAEAEEGAAQPSGDDAIQRAVARKLRSSWDAQVGALRLPCV